MKQSRKMECRKNDNKNLANAEEGKKKQMQMVKIKMGEENDDEEEEKRRRRKWKKTLSRNGHNFDGKI
jgi:hypothetical protein